MTISRDLAPRCSLTYRESVAVQVAEQEAINRLADAGVSAEGILGHILRVAARQMDCYGQYDGTFARSEGWKLGRIRSDIVTKGGVRFVAGDLVAFRPRYRGLSRVWYDAQPEAWSIRGSITVAEIYPEPID